MRYRNALQQIWTWVLSIAGLLVLTIALPSLSIWVVLMTGIVSLIAVLHPLPRLWLPTRKKAGCVLALSFGLLAVGGAHLPEPPPATPEEFEAQAEKRAAQAEVRIRQAKVRGEARRRTEAAKKRPAAVIQAEANAARTQAPAEAPPTPEGEWNVHEFKVVEDEAPVSAIAYDGALESSRPPLSRAKTASRHSSRPPDRRGESTTRSSSHCFCCRSNQAPSCPD